MSAMTRVFRMQQWVDKYPALNRMLDRLQTWHLNAAGHYKLGLHTDDLIDEQHKGVPEALARLDPREASDRIFRFKRASHLMMCNEELPESEWVTVKTDKHYLRHLLHEVELEMAEKKKYKSQ